MSIPITMGNQLSYHMGELPYLPRQLVDLLYYHEQRCEEHATFIERHRFAHDEECEDCQYDDAELNSVKFEVRRIEREARLLRQYVEAFEQTAQMAVEDAYERGRRSDREDAARQSPLVSSGGHSPSTTSATSNGKEPEARQASQSDDAIAA